MEALPKTDALGHAIRDNIAIKCDDRFMVDLQVSFDPETGSTKPDASNQIDLVKLIQTYKDQCGMEAAKKLLKTGQAQPSDFADDGQHSGDVPEFLDSAQGRANAAILAKGKADALAESLDLPPNAEKLTEEQLAAIISKAIQEKYPDIIEKKEVSSDAE